VKALNKWDYQVMMILHSNFFFFVVFDIYFTLDFLWAEIARFFNRFWLGEVWLILNCGLKPKFVNLILFLLLMFF
jgi:hypothetical protein